MNARTLLGFGVCIAIGAGLVLGFSETGSPAHNRQVALDERRVDAIRTIAQQIGAPGDTKPNATAPPSMPPASGYAGANDVRSQVAYAKTGSRTYQLCSTFELDGDSTSEYYADKAWAHTAGRYCYAFTLDSSMPTATQSPQARND